MLPEGFDKGKFGQKFQDMRIRVLNERSCQIIWARPGNSSPYAALFLYRSGSGELHATFGDLTISVTDEHAMILLSIAQDEDSPFRGQW